MAAAMTSAARAPRFDFLLPEPRLAPMPDYLTTDEEQAEQPEQRVHVQPEQVDVRELAEHDDPEEDDETVAFDSGVAGGQVPRQQVIEQARAVKRRYRYQIEEA